MIIIFKVLLRSTINPAHHILVAGPLPEVLKTLRKECQNAKVVKAQKELVDGGYIPVPLKVIQQILEEGF